MYFTKQDYEKILDYIINHSVKDTQFEETYSINGNELISLVQNGVNKNIRVSELIKLFDEYGVEVKIQQDEGESFTMVMSQKAVTDALNDIRDIIDLNAELGTVQQQIDNINIHIGGPSEESIQSQINNINEHIGGESEQSIQSQIDSLSTRKLERALAQNDGDLVDDFDHDYSESREKTITARLAKALNTRIDNFIYTPVPDTLQIGVNNEVLEITLN